MADAKLTALTETSAPALDDLLYSVDTSDTTDDPAGSSRKLSFDRLLGILAHVCDGRLTTESGVPVSTSDRSAQSTVYYTPYTGNRVSLYDGTRWRLYTFTERSLALSGLTSGKNYDVFLYDNSGTLTLELSAAWTDGTTRADALTTQDGVYVKSGATTRRHLGTIRTTGTTTTADVGGGVTSNVGAQRFVWNRYNQVHRHLNVHDTTDNWTYTTNSIRQARATAGNMVEWVTGDAAEFVEVVLLAPIEMAGTTTIGAIGVGVDSTTVMSGVYSEFYNNNALTAISPNTARYAGCPGLGYHYAAWLEKGFTGGAFYGDDGGGSQAGIRGSLLC